MPKFTPGKNANAFSNAASLFCLLSPVIGLGLLPVADLVIPHLGASEARFFAVTVGAIYWLLLMSVPTMGFLAVLLMKEGGRRRVVTCSLLGFVLWGAWMALDTHKFQQVRARELARHEAYANVAAAQKDLDRQALNTTAQTVSFKNYVEALDQAAKSTTGEDALVLKANAAYMLQYQKLESVYAIAMSNAPPREMLNISNLVSRETLRKRQDAVQSFLICNTNMWNFVSADEDNYRVELERFNVSRARIETEAVNYHKRIAARQTALEAIHQGYDKINRGTLAMLELLDNNWGHWTYDQDKGQAQFENADQTRQYTAALMEVKKGIYETKFWSKQLTKVVSQNSPQ